MWVLLIIAAAVMLSGTGSPNVLTRQGSAGPSGKNAALYQAMCELWREGVYDARSLQLATALTLRPSLERMWRAFAQGSVPTTGNLEPWVWWNFVGGVADEVVARPSLLCQRKG
jgi:hypothetical protein